MYVKKYSRDSTEWTILLWFIASNDQWIMNMLLPTARRLPPTALQLSIEDDAAYPPPPPPLLSLLPSLLPSLSCDSDSADSSAANFSWLLSVVCAPPLPLLPLS
jgi:hypothetical protein